MLLAVSSLVRSAKRQDAVAEALAAATIRDSRESKAASRKATTLGLTTLVFHKASVLTAPRKGRRPGSADRDVVLCVPFKGKLPEPPENYSGSAKGGWKKFGPYLRAITGLEAEGNHLRVTLGMKDWARALDFNIDDLREGKGK